MDVHQRGPEVARQLAISKQKRPGIRTQRVGLPPRVHRKAHAAFAGDLLNVVPRARIEIIFVTATPGLLVREPFEGLEAVLKGVMKRVPERGRGEGGLVANLNAERCGHIKPQRTQRTQRDPKTAMRACSCGGLSLGARQTWGSQTAGFLSWSFLCDLCVLCGLFRLDLHLRPRLDNITLPNRFGQLRPQLRIPK